MTDVAVLGAGRMGGAMARRLAAQGDRVTIWNRTRSAAEAVASSDAAGRIEVANDAATAASQASVVISMLANGTAAREVLLHGSLREALPSGAVVCDLATSGPTVARELAHILTRSGALFLDAPVSGSVAAVESGTLLVMASGAPVALSAARPVLANLADRIVRVGDAGAGQSMKLAVNLVVHDLNAALAESLQLAENAGITRENAYSVLQQSVVGAPFVQYKRDAFLDPQAPVAMSLDLVAKDLDLIQQLAEQLGVELPVTAAASEATNAARAAGLGAADMAALSRLRRRARTGEVSRVTNR
jgi:3-hydroxyisobutyrate dehydrogenase